MLIDVKEHLSLKRDMKGGQIINTDLQSLTNYNNMRATKIAESERLNKIESDMSDIKALLMQLLQEKQCQSS